MPAWHSLVVPDAKPKIGATLAELGVGAYSGHEGRLKIGSGVDAHYEQFIWDGTLLKWIGFKKYNVLVTVDAWALDWSRQPLSAIRNQWARPNGGVGWARSGAAAILRTDVTIPASGTFTLPIMDYGATTLPPQGNITARGMVFTYTGVTTTVGAAVITGVTGGTPGVILTAGNTPLIPYAPVLGGGGDPGGWGTVSFKLDHVGEIWSAGFVLQEQMHGWMNGSQDNKAMQIAPFYLNYNPGEDFLYPNISSPPPSGILGPGITLLGTNLPMSPIGSGVGGTVIDERRFDWTEGNWSPWVATIPTKRYLIPIIYGKMPADANDNGQTYGVTLYLRWIQP